MTRSGRRGALLLLLALPISACGSSVPSPPSGTISVVAVEDQYGSIASAIGGKWVYVTSLLKDPNTDPHEFEASPSTARALSDAGLVIKNGLGYDSWIDRLLSASPRSGRAVVTVGSLLGHKVGDNPHVWYAPGGWPKVARTIATSLSRLDPKHRAYFMGRERAWVTSLQPVYHQIAALRRQTAAKTVIATEPVYGYMLDALGLTSLDSSFQKAIMDGTDPSPRSVAAFQSALQHHTVHVLVYNSQVTDPTTARMRTVASQYHVPLVGVSETQPPALSFVHWQLSQLRTLRRMWR